MIFSGADIGVDKFHCEASEGAGKNCELDESRDLRAPRISGNARVVEYLQQRRSLRRLCGNEHDGRQGSCVTATTTCVVDNALSAYATDDAELARQQILSRTLWWGHAAGR
jgi:hypothetical protein